MSDTEQRVRIAVIGLGLLGQITVQLLKAHGCRVIGVDLDASKVALARRLGADVAVARNENVTGAVERECEVLPSPLAAVLVRYRRPRRVDRAGGRRRG